MAAQTDAREPARPEGGADKRRLGGARVGRPAASVLVSGYFAAGLACWLAASVALVAAAGPLAAGDVASPRLLLAVHLVAVGFLPLAVTGGALHILPTLLRTSPSLARGAAALPLLCAGPALAYGIAHDAGAVLWPAATAETIGFLLIAWELCSLAARAPRGRMLLASRAGVLLSVLNAAAALAFGGALASREGGAFLGIPHERAIAIHLHLAVLGWLTLLLVTVGRTLGPMLALAPSEPARRAPLEEIGLCAGVWLLAAGFAAGVRAVEVAGGLAVLAAVGRFAQTMTRVAREHRLDVPEGPLLHLLAGLFFLAQAAVLGLGMLLGLPVTPRRLVAYVLALLVGWAAGATLGHLGKLHSLSLWAAWPPGPRPKQAALYPRRLWICEAAAFAAGIEIAVDGVLAGSRGAVTAGAALVVAAALAAGAGLAATLRAGRAGFRLRDATTTGRPA